ncbi:MULTISPECIES: hypothetical protein [Streptomyces violaceusniger group]|nr:hypothetical protein [Streptomyces javensis]
MEIIDGATAAFGPYRTSPQPASAVLADIRALGIRVLSDLPTAVLQEQIPADIAEAHLSTDAVSPHTGQAMERPGFMAPPRAANTAVAVTMALRSLLEAVREELTQISATSIDSWGRGISPVLQSVHLAALAPSLRPSEYVRYRIMIETPRRPTRTTRDIEQRARKIPTMFWPPWTIRLAPPEGTHARALAPVLAALLLIPDSRTSLDQAAGLIGDVIDGTEVSRLLQEVDDLPQWPDIATALDRLADYLGANSTPINYGRRRLLDYTGLLPHDRWLEICRHTEHHREPDGANASHAASSSNVSAACPPSLPPTTWAGPTVQSSGRRPCGSPRFRPLNSRTPSSRKPSTSWPHTTSTTSP